MTAVMSCLAQWLQARLSGEQWQWLHERQLLLSSSSNTRDLHISLGLIPRKLGRADLALEPDELVAAQQASNHAWDPTDWTIDAAARIWLLCTAASQNEVQFASLFRDLCRTADLNESITFYRGLPLYPHSAELDKQVGEGLRTNIRAVFEAIAHRNSYPREHFDENRWNHMILKALFIDSTLSPIQGLDERANPELARILCHYAHERWAAHRTVTPELWRCVGPFAEADMLDDLLKVSESEQRIEQMAALVALSRCREPRAQQALKQHPEIHQLIVSGELTWESLANELVQYRHTPSGENA